MSLKRAVLALFAFLVGSLLLFSGTGPGMLLGGTVIAIVAAAVGTAISTSQRDAAWRRLRG